MDVRVLLFGSTLKTALTVVFGVGLVVGGATVTGVVGVPGVARLDNAFGPVNETDTTVYSDLVVHNPNPVGVRLGDTTVDYRIDMNDVTVATGTKHGVGVTPGNSTINLTTYLKNDRIPPWWVSHVRNGENTSVVVTAEVHSGLLGRTTTYQTSPQYVTTNITDQFNSTETRPIPGPTGDPLLYVNQTNATWGAVTNETTPLETRFVVYNPHRVPVTFTKLGYNITMNDVAVGSGATEEEILVPPRGTQVVTATTNIRNQRLDEWWVSHLRQNQTTEFNMDFYAVVDSPLPGVNDLRLPLQNAAYTEIIRTYIFQEVKEEVGPENGTQSTTTTTEPLTTERETSDTTALTGSVTDAVPSVVDSTTEATDTTKTTSAESAANETTTDGTTASETTTTTSDDGSLLDVRDAGGRVAPVSP
ncbi:LEA type 2 family protein [Halocalculus aciditolerans]|uniref:Water stress and hypersensitive response domain-containing protein n=1 Tax=Halocalculus aciditolerans TaxID=1383812 RepID=A0A830FJ86_9EURY|nr:LEA type 2 family protein [Halocalculus aciditolerans]GGL58183.1 hypothetical protein GCM10009039_15460 [Halocalculus aciditolerans]